MAFKMSTQKVTGTVNVVEIGTGDKAIALMEKQEMHQLLEQKYQIYNLQNG